MEDNQVALLAFLATLTFVIFLGYIIFRIWDVIEQRRSPASTMGSGSFKAEISASQKTTDPIYDQIYAAEKQTGTTKAIASDLVTEFLDSVLFASDLHSSPDASWAAFFTSLLQHHRYTAVFFVPTNKFNRTLRWTSLTMGFLLNLFIVTVFFGTFFPDTDDNENCNVYTTKESCLNDEYGVGNTNLCSWNAATLTCGDKRPSRTFVYLILVVLLVVVISIPFQVAYDYLLVNVCMRRPRFEDWGIAAASWMGRYAANEENDLTMPTDSRAEKLLVVDDFESSEVYDGSLSERDEIERLQVLSSEILRGSPHSRKESVAKRRAIEQSIGAFENGVFTPYATLNYDMTSARSGAAGIVRKLSWLPVIEMHTKETLLLQHFILEQFSVVQQFILRRHMHDFTSFSQAPVNPLLWLVSWVWIVLSGAFFLASAFAWGATHRGSSSAAWGIVLGVALVQDLFVIQVFRAVAVYVVSMRSIRPQLQVIYDVLHRLAVSHAHDSLGGHFGNLRVCQHLSPACRAAHSEGAHNLAAATILRRVEDSDVATCRAASVPLLWVAAVPFAVPAVFGLLVDVLGVAALGALLPAFFDAFLIMNRYLYAGAGYFILAVYLFVFALIALWKLLLEPALREARPQQTAAGAKEGFAKSTSSTAVAAGAGHSDVMPQSPLVAAPEIEIEIDFDAGDIFRKSEMEAPPLSRALDAELAEMQEQENALNFQAHEDF